MEFKDIIQKRRSVRVFTAESVSDEKLCRVLEAARLAPSTKNCQAWKFVVVKDSNKRKALTQAPMGYPAGETAARLRKPIEEVMCYEKFTE